MDKDSAIIGDDLTAMNRSQIGTEKEFMDGTSAMFSRINGDDKSAISKSQKIGPSGMKTGRSMENELE